jgi:hypothetical protein
MPSPEALIAAAKPGPPLNEKEIKTLQNNYDKRFDWGFKGQHQAPADYATRAGRRVLTPSHWRHVGIEERNGAYGICQLVSHVAFTATDFRLLGLPEDSKGTFETLEGAEIAGGDVENATRRVLLERAQQKSSSKKRAK